MSLYKFLKKQFKYPTIVISNMIKKIILLIVFLYDNCNAETPNCQKLWDMNNRINGIEIYKMGLYACIEGPMPNLRGALPQLIPPPNITILNSSQILSNETNRDLLNISSLNISQNNITSLETNSFSTTTIPPSIINNETTPGPIIIPTITTTITTAITTPITTPAISNISNFSQPTSFNQNNIKNNIANTNGGVLTTIHIIIISSSVSLCCFATLLYFIYKAHLKSKIKTEKKDTEKNIENGDTIHSNKLANTIYYSNKLRNNVFRGTRGTRGFKNRNSWSKDNRVKPDKQPLAPKLPEPNINVKVNTYKNKKPGLKLDVKTEVPTQKFQIKEITEHKKQSSFVPGSPRRRLPTPPQRAPPPPTPSFASKSLANKLDKLNTGKISPKIQRIVQKNR